MAALIMQYVPGSPASEQSGLQVSENEQIDMVDGSFISTGNPHHFTNPTQEPSTRRSCANFVTQY